MNDEYEGYRATQNIDGRRDGRESYPIFSHNDRSVINPSFDQAIDQIVGAESDTLLEVADNSSKAESSRREGFKDKFFGFWVDSKLRNIILAAVLLLAIAIVAIPNSRYFGLNTFGVRAKASILVTDKTTGLPLRNMPVNLQGNESISNSDGVAEFAGLKLGESNLIIKKLGFADLEKNITIGLGSNQLVPVEVVSTGARYEFSIKKWLSNESLSGVEASSAGYFARSDDDGKLSITLGKLEPGAEIKFNRGGFRQESVKISDLKGGVKPLEMVPSNRHSFVSNRDGNYDLYTIDVDGKNEKILLEASGKEREIPTVIAGSESSIAYITSRDGKVNKEGFILDGLYIINTETGESNKIDQSEQLHVLGWIGRNLVYVSVGEGASAASADRSKLHAYNNQTKTDIVLASANYFNDAKIVNEQIYYAVSSYSIDPSQAKLYSVDSDGGNLKTVIDKQVWSITRTGYGTLVFADGNNKYYKLNLSNSELIEEKIKPVVKDNILYSLSSDKSKASNIELRDGKGALVITKTQDGSKDTKLTMSGAENPSSWVGNDYIIFRVSNNSETADYIVSTGGDSPRKISDVVGNRSRYFY